MLWSTARTSSQQPARSSQHAEERCGQRSGLECCERRSPHNTRGLWLSFGPRGLLPSYSLLVRRPRPFRRAAQSVAAGASSVAGRQIHHHQPGASSFSSRPATLVSPSSISSRLERAALY